MERRSLSGLRVLVTRAAEDSQELHRMLREFGAEILSLPATRTGPPDDPGPLDAAIAAIANSSAAPAFDWIGFTSAHAVSAFMDRLLGKDDAGPAEVPGSTISNATHRPDARALVGIRLAAVGPATQAALERYGLFADLVPDRAAGRHLAAAFGDVSGLRILLPRSDIALRDLPDALKARGAIVTEVVAYVTRPAPADPRVLENVLSGKLGAVTFFSPSAVDGFEAQVAPREPADILRDVAVVCVGETTAQAARSKGLTGVLVAADATAAGVVHALVEWRREQEDGV
jgi:uroporphyrinogen-III synthase